MWFEAVTPCECPRPGWCPRHQTHKPGVWHQLCRTQPEYFALWETGDGPRTDAPHPVGHFPTSRGPCRFRSAESHDAVSCLCCGGRSISVPVFACEKFGSCVEEVCRSATPPASTPPSCMTCPEHQPIE